jgi:hypothetical protein
VVELAHRSGGFGKNGVAGIGLTRLVRQRLPSTFMRSKPMAGSGPTASSSAISTRHPPKALTAIVWEAPNRRARRTGQATLGGCQVGENNERSR